MIECYKFGTNPVQYCMEGKDFTFQVVQRTDSLDYYMNDKSCPKKTAHSIIIHKFGLNPTIGKDK